MADDRSARTTGAVPASARRLLRPLLALYLAALTLAAWPVALLPDALADAQDEAQALFKRARIRADAMVFRGDENPYKRRTLSIFILGRYADGEVETLYRSYRGLRPGRVRFFDDVFDTALKRMSGMGHIHALRDPDPRSRARVVARLRRSAQLAGMSRYFARAPQTPRQVHLREVYTVWFFESSDYATGQDYPIDAVVHRYDVRSDGPGRGPFPTVARDGDETPRLEFR